MVAERPLRAFLSGRNVAFQHDLRVSRHHKVNAHCRRQLNAGVADEPGEGHLVHLGRQRRRSGPDGRRIAAQRHRNFELIRTGPVVPGAYLVGLPVHPGGARVENLHPVDAVILRPRLRIFGDYQGQSYVRPGVLGPALDDGQAVKVNVLAGQDDLLAGGVANRAGLVGSDVRQPSQRPQLVHQALGRAAQRHVDHGLQTGG